MKKVFIFTAILLLNAGTYAQDIYAHLLDILTREEWIEGKGQDILDLDETLRQCEQNALKSAEQNAINTKYGMIYSTSILKKEAIKEGKTKKIDKRIVRRIRNVVRVIKLEEKILSLEKEPVKVGQLNTFLCKAHVKLRVKGVITQSDLRNIFEDNHKSKKTEKKKITKKSETVSLPKGNVNLSSLRTKPKKTYNSTSRRSRYSTYSSTNYRYSGILFELTFGYAYSVYSLGTKNINAETVSNQFTIGAGYIFKDFLALTIGLGGIVDSFKSNYDFINPENTQNREIPVSTSYAKFGTMIFFLPHVFLRTEYIKTTQKISEAVELSGSGYIIGIGYKPFRGGSLELRYTSAKNSNKEFANALTSLKQVALVLNLSTF